MTSVPLVSIVVPVLRDAAPLALLLRSLEGPSPANPTDVRQSGGYEVIVVNGDDGDSSLAPLRRRFSWARWVDSQPGRALQMNDGARVARGRWLFFVHADTCLDSAWFTELASLDSKPVVGGALRFQFTSSGFPARLIEWGVAIRVRWFGLPYGDQGLFVRRHVFEEMGGFAGLPIMEDVEFARRLRRRGHLFWSPVPIAVSPRRWERDGWIQRSFLNIWLVVMYFIGVSPEWLARTYYHGYPESLGTPGTDAEERLTPGVFKSGGVGDYAMIQVIVPAFDEQEAIGLVLDEVPDLVSRVVVVDNGSTDETAETARAHGAQVVSEPRKGYGRACLAGLRATSDADIIVFLDADRSDYPAEMTKLVSPILGAGADLVLGTRVGPGRGLTARLGTQFCVSLINRIWGTGYRDLGPFRAVRRAALDRLGMNDPTWGWTIEMQVKAAEAGLGVIEVPVRQRPRIGRSKISGTVVGTVRAGSRMLATIWSLRRTRGRRLYK